MDGKTVERGIQPNVMNSQPRAVDEKMSVDGIIPLHHQPIAQSGRAEYLAHIIYEEDGLDLDGVGDTGEIVLCTLSRCYINNHYNYNSTNQFKTYV